MHEIRCDTSPGVRSKQQCMSTADACVGARVWMDGCAGREGAGWGRGGGAGMADDSGWGMERTVHPLACLPPSTSSHPHPPPPASIHSPSSGPLRPSAPSPEPQAACPVEGGQGQNGGTGQRAREGRARPNLHRRLGLVRVMICPRPFSPSRVRASGSCPPPPRSLKAWRLPLRRLFLRALAPALARRRRRR